MNPGITVIALAKNEEARMRRCLASLRDHIETVVALVDPQSTDRSADVVREFGGTVLDFEWPGGFDAARNLCLERVQTEWVLWIDADEWFAGDDAKHLRELTGRSDAFCFGLVRQDVNEAGAQTRSQVVRLWRSRPYIPFQGLVHEHLDFGALGDSGVPGKEYGTDLTFYHDGYSLSVIPEKATRYVRLLEEELKLRPGSLFYEVKLACTLAVAEDRRSPQALLEVGDHLLRLSDECDEAPIEAAEAFGPMLAALPESEWRSARSDALIRLARGWFSDNPAVLWNVSQFEIKRGNLVGAFHCLLDLEALADSGRYDGRTPYLAAMIGKGLYTNLALVAHQLGRKDVARRNYERLLKEDPNNAVARQNMRLL